MQAIIIANDIEIRQCHDGVQIRRIRQRFMVSEKRIAASEVLYQHGKISAEAYLKRAGHHISLLRFKRSYDLESDDITLANNTVLPASSGTRGVYWKAPLQVGYIQLQNNDNHEDSTDEAESSGDDFPQASTSSEPVNRRAIALACMR